MTPVASVIIPTYNRAELLREALDSVAAQTFRDIETIVVDDGSTEDVAAAVRGHTTFARLIRQARGGPAAARNRGVAHASGDWLAFLDSDDLWMPEKLKRYLDAAARRPDVSIWYGPMQPIDSQRRPVPGRTKPCASGRITAALFGASFVHVPTVLCRRDLYTRFGGFDESLRVCEDYDLWLRMSTQVDFGLIEEPLALRRLHDARWSKSSMHRNLAVKIDVLERFYRSPEARGHLDDSAARRRLARTAFAAGRAAWWCGRFVTAGDLLRRALDYGAPPLRVWPFLGIAGLLRALARDRRQWQAPAPVAPPAPRTP